MTDERELGKELLKRNGIEPGELPENGRRELRRMVERDKKRAERMKWATVVAWSLLALLYILAGVLPRILGILGVAPMFVTFAGEPHPWTVVLLFPIVVLFWVAVACTISFLIRSRSVSQREIQASLADIAEQLRQLVKDQQAERSKAGGQPGRESGSETKRD